MKVNTYSGVGPGARNRKHKRMDHGMVRLLCTQLLTLQAIIGGSPPTRAGVFIARPCFVTAAVCQFHN